MIMFKYLAILLSPLLRVLERSALVRNMAEKVLRRFPGLKLYLATLLYGSAMRVLPGRTLHMGPEQQRIHEELNRRLTAEKK